jgi:hypothetical protein
MGEWRTLCRMYARRHSSIAVWVWGDPPTLDSLKHSKYYMIAFLRPAPTHIFTTACLAQLPSIYICVFDRKKKHCLDVLSSKEGEVPSRANARWRVYDLFSVKCKLSLQHVNVCAVFMGSICSVRLRRPTERFRSVYSSMHLECLGRDENSKHWYSV